MFNTIDRSGIVNNSLLGVHPRKIQIQMNGDVIAEESKFNHVKAVGRRYNGIDNMDRKFVVKGFSPKAKIDMWDMMTIADSLKK
jgi:hypothetical protein